MQSKLLLMSFLTLYILYHIFFKMSNGAKGEIRTHALSGHTVLQTGVLNHLTTFAYNSLMTYALQACKSHGTVKPDGSKPQTGIPGTIRTPDTRIRNPLFYPTELQGQIYQQDSLFFLIPH